MKEVPWENDLPDDHEQFDFDFNEIGSSKYEELETEQTIKELNNGGCGMLILLIIVVLIICTVIAILV